MTLSRSLDNAIAAENRRFLADPEAQEQARRDGERMAELLAMTPEQRRAQQCIGIEQAIVALAGKPAWRKSMLRLISDFNTLKAQA
jgi:hypothetical protein